MPPTVAKTPPSGSTSEIAQKAQQGLIPFLIASAIGGLFALVMPCVWPMVPITVNFFVKQGQGTGGPEEGDRAGHHLLPVDHRRLHGGRRPLLVLLLGGIAPDAWRTIPG